MSFVFSHTFQLNWMIVCEVVKQFKLNIVILLLSGVSVIREIAAVLLSMSTTVMLVCTGMFVNRSGANLVR